MLAGLVGHARVAWLGLFMVLSSLTEGFGLLLLLPITRIVSGEPLGVFDGGWLGAIAQLPTPVVLAMAVAIISLRALIVYVVLELRHGMGLSLTRQLRTMSKQAVLGADWRWLSQQNSADHSALIVGEAARVGSLADQALSIATGLVTLGALLGSSMYVSWRLTFCALAAGVVAGGLIWILRASRDRVGDVYSQAYSELQHHVSNGLIHLRAARIAGAQAVLDADFTRTAIRLEQLEQRYLRSIARAHLLFQVAAVVMLALLVYIALKVLGVPLTVLVPILAIFGRIVPLAGTMQQGIRSWQFCQPALDEVLALIGQAQQHPEPAAVAAERVELSRMIELRGVSLRYAGRARPVFDGFDLAIRAGSVVGIAGPSGSGKSSLADMLSGLIAPDDGTILIDGEPLDPARRMRWRQQVAYVEQVPYLFDGTIAENLAWGLSAPDPDALREAVEAASAAFVFALPHGLDTLVGEGGRQLSGGERQRLSLARALLRNPDLLILDEVTAALDSANEAAIMDTIARLRGSCTVLILGHRAALLDLADEIVDLGAMGADRASAD